MNQPNPQPQTVNQHKPLILIIDDTPANLAVLTKSLFEHSFDIAVARNSESGRKKARIAQPDLILLNVLLPDLDGIETCRLLKKEPDTGHIPVIVMTATANDAEQKSKCFRVGAVDYLTKPFQEEEMMARITTQLNLQSLTRRLQTQTLELQQEITKRQRAETALQKQQGQLEALVETQTNNLKKTNHRLWQEITERQHSEAILARRTQELTHLYEISLEINTLTHLPTLLNTIARYATQLSEVNQSLLFLINPVDGMLELAAYAPVEEEGLEMKLAPGEGLMGRVIQNDEVMMITNYAQWEGRLPFLPTDSLGRILAVPLKHGNRVVGALGVLDKKTTPFDANKVQLLKLFAAQAATAIQQLRLLETESGQRKRLDVLRQILEKLTALRDLNEVLTQIAEAARLLLGADDGSVDLYRPEQNRLETVMGIGYSLAGWPLIFREYGEGLAGKVWEAGAPVIVNDYQTWPHRPPQLAHIGGSVMGVPIQWGDKFLGVLTIGTLTQKQFTSEDAALLAQFATHAAIAIENTRLLEAERRRTVQLESLQRVSEKLSALDNPHELLKQIIEAARLLLNGDEGAISLYRPKQELLETVMITGNPAPIPENRRFRKKGEGMAGIVWATGQPLIVKDYQQWPQRTPHLTQVTGSILAVPIQWGDKFLGVLGIDRRNPATYFGQEDAILLSQFATQAAIALERARLLEAEHHRAQQLEVLHQVSQKLAALQDLDQLLWLISEQAVLLLGVDEGGVNLYRPELDALETVIGPGFPSEHRAFQQPGEGVAGMVWQTGQPVVVDDYQTWPHKPARLAHITGSIIGVPIRWANKFLGTLAVRSIKPHRQFSPEEVSLLTQFAVWAAIAIENVRLYEQAQQEIIERQNVETQLKVSLAEKEVLLKEIHHRVKNNMQVISSLLDLQADQIEEPQIRELFQESQNRIKSMALIHERLYQSQDLARIDFAQYIESLANYILHSYQAKTGQTRLQLNIKPVSLSIETAIPCGLIVNELVSNAFKHAFPNGRSGEIWIELQKFKNQQLALTVRDNGIGFPPELDFQRSHSLGLTLVNILVKQINGEIELGNENGASFTIIFSDPGR